MGKKIAYHLLSAATGWVAGLLTILLLSFLWLKIIPVIDRTGQGSGLPTILLIIMAVLSPVPIIGGFIGGMIPKEGGRKDQTIYAVIISIFLTVPFTLFVLWYTGF